MERRGALEGCRPSEKRAGDRTVFGCPSGWETARAEAVGAMAEGAASQVRGAGVLGVLVNGSACHTHRKGPDGECGVWRPQTAPGKALPAAVCLVAALRQPAWPAVNLASGIAS